MAKLGDQSAEKLILTTLAQSGLEALGEVDDIITSASFTCDDNQLIYDVLKTSIDAYSSVNLNTFLSTSRDLGYDSFLSDKEQIKSLFNGETDSENIRKLAKKIKKIEIAIQLQKNLKEALNVYKNITGNESVNEIFGIAEKAIDDVDASLSHENNDRPVSLFEGLTELLEHLEENPVDQVGISTGFASLDSMIGGGLRDGYINLCVARPKALRYGSKVYTSTGSINIEDIKVGDKILHPFAGEVKVTHVWDHKDKDIYRIYFRDGDYVDCCEDHIWHVYNRRHKGTLTEKREFLKTTKELINDLTSGNNYKWDIPLPNILDFQEQEVEIDPYAMGILLGDGSVSNNTCVYHTADNKIHQYMLEYAKSIGCNVKIDNNKKDNQAISYRINSMQNKLRKAGIFGHNCYSKFIPKNYIYNTKEVRLAILAGLLDTDGDCVVDKKSKQSRTRFTSVSKQLCLDVKEIVQSLGGLCSIIDNKTSCNGKYFYSYRCEIRLPKGINPFRLKRKADKFTNRVIGELKRTIVKIEKIDQDNARCLTLDIDDGLFMTDNYVVTHNSGKSTLAIAIARNIGKNHIPVLYLDTEMDKKTTALRRLAAEAGIDYEFIETGRFKNHPKRNILYQIAGDLENNDYVNYQRIAGKKFDEVLNIIKRWVKKDVGFDENGNTNPCVVIYDYFKLMQASEIDDMSEFQALGYQLSKLTDFLGNFGVACLGFVQANRDGITKESTDIVSQSDRLVWFCSSLFLLRKKTNEEILEEGASNGNRKMVPLDGMRFAKDCEGWLNFNCQNFDFKECGIGTTPDIETE